ncbi:13846_t:CDS:2 [Funneliformis caledonium]|uniref:Small ribosomal subunit protein uS17c n=1 Tax=Funneliformis caledonium TaxID=1117310 RepID=A0A9N8VPG2_9GLOM|nr:13846_t:CDS:2 [Funneliformis caledonium]
MTRQNFIGMVISTAMQKTVKVRVQRHFMHPKIQKNITRHKNFLAHDENQLCSLGDIVRIEACRPLSKMKSFIVAEIMSPAKTWVDPETKEVKR